MNELPLSILDSYEHYTCSKRIHNLVLATLKNDSYVQYLCSQISDGLNSMELALGKALKSEYTSLLIDGDCFRDKAFLGFKSYVNTLTHSPDPVKASAAFYIKDIINDSGTNLHRLGYVEETARLNSLIKALTSPEAVKNINTIGATAWFNEMENSQKNFERIYKEKIETETAINLPLLKDAKKKITFAMKALLIYVESNVGQNPEVFAPLEDQINAAITEIVAIARSRITRIENEKKAAAAAK